MSNVLEFAIDRQEKLEKEYAEKKHIRGSMNDFITVVTDKEGKISTIEEHGAACYARLEYNVQEGQTPEYLIVPFMTARVGWNRTKDVQEDFLDYVMNRSPYRDIFVIRDAQHALKYGVLCRTDVPANLLISGLTVIRTLWEYTYIPLEWKNLVDLGVDENMALLAAHYVSRDAEGNIYVQRNGGGHRAFDRIGIETATNFLKNIPKKTTKTYKEWKTYGQIHALFGNTADDLFTKHKAKDVVKGAWGAEAIADKTIEPFAKFLIKWTDILLGKKAAPGEKVKPVGTPTEENLKALIAMITVANGFSLAEVRSIRKNLRVIAAGAGLGWTGALNIRENPSINNCINWASTSQGSLYWHRINSILKKRIEGYDRW